MAKDHDPAERDAADAAHAPVASLARDLLRRLRADPGRMPELLAGFSVEFLAPRATARVNRLRAERPEASDEELADAVVTHGVRRTVAEGAFVGGPLLLLIPLAFCAALLTQLQLVLEIAAVSGRDPAEPARTAELLTLQGAYPDTSAAAAALAGRDRHPPSSDTAGSDAAGTDAERETAAAGQGRFGALWSLSLRMAALLGLTAPGDPDADPVSWLSRAGQWTLVGVILIVGWFAPLVWLPYMAVTYRTATRRLAERARNAYLEGAGPRSAVSGSRAVPGLLVAVLNALVSLVLAGGLAALALGIDIRLGGSAWPAVFLVLLGGAGVVAAVWWLRRSGRHRR